MIYVWVPGYTLDKIEESAIRQALNYYRGNKTQTASALGISIRTIDNKLNRYGISDVKKELVKDAPVVLPKKG